MKRTRGPSTITRKRHRSAPKLWYFSVRNVIYPRGYFQAYQKLRHTVQSGEDPDEFGAQQNAVGRQIRDGSARITFEAVIYNDRMEVIGEADRDDWRSVKRYTWRCKPWSKASPGVYIPFIEPYIVYVARTSTPRKITYFTRLVTRIVDMRVIPFTNTPSGATRLAYMLTREMGMTPYGARSVAADIRRTSHRSPAVSDEALSGALERNGDMLARAQERTMYYILRAFLAAKELYKDQLVFDNVLIARLTQPMIVDLAQMLANEPWRVALPGNWARYCMESVSTQTLRAVEVVWKKHVKRTQSATTDGYEDEAQSRECIETACKHAESVHGTEFPPAYIWANVMYHALVRLQKGTSDMYATYGGLYESMRTMAYGVSRAHDAVQSANAMYMAPDEEVAGMDPIIAKIAALPFTGGLDYFRGYAPAALAMRLLHSDKSVVFTPPPQLVSRTDGRIAEAFGCLWAQIRPDPAHPIADDTDVDPAAWPARSFRGAMNLVDTMYRPHDESRADFAPMGSPEQHLYIRAAWDFQAELTRCLHVLVLRNRAFNQYMPAARAHYQDTPHFRMLNDLQRRAVIRGAYDAPVTITLGGPGTGKTEVARALVDALDAPGVVTFACGVNGITANVLRKRLAATNKMDDPGGCRRVGAKKKRAKKGDAPRHGVLLAMTCDMVVAKSRGMASDIPHFHEYLHTAQTLIIDEVQNMDVRRLARLMAIMPNLTRLRCFGDLQQIQPIGLGCIGRWLADACPSTQVVTLTINNRVRANPDSQSIVHNFEAISAAKHFDTNYRLHHGQPGAGVEFCTTDDAAPRILALYKGEGNFAGIDMMTPMHVDKRRLNALLGDDIRGIIMRTRFWRDVVVGGDPTYARGKRRAVPQITKGVPPARYTVAGVSVQRYFLRPGNKVRFKRNYSRQEVRTKKIVITSAAVYNGETAWISWVEERLVGQRETVHVLHLYFADGSRREVIVGDRHVAPGDVEEGYFTSIDAMLGGESVVSVLYLGTGGAWTDNFWSGAMPSIYKNLGWVDRRRIVSAVSRPKRSLLVISPRLLMTRDHLIRLCEYREKKQGRKFFHSSTIKDRAYSLDAPDVLKLMADLAPRDRLSSLRVHFINAMRARGGAPLNFVEGGMRQVIPDDDEETESMDD